MAYKTRFIAALTGVFVGIFTIYCAAQEGSDKAPFGGQEDVAYAEQLWQTLVKTNLAGDEAILAVPYAGQHPHGAVLETLSYDKLNVADHTGPVIVKRNYGGEDVSKEKVANHPNEYLGAVTVMYQREEGYDPENNNWFWAKYKPDGSLEQNPKGMSLAGRVAKGAPQGCIACHSSAPGNDLVFNNNRYAR